MTFAVLQSSKSAQGKSEIEVAKMQARARLERLGFVNTKALFEHLTSLFEVLSTVHHGKGCVAQGFGDLGMDSVGPQWWKPCRITSRAAV